MSPIGPFSWVLALSFCLCAGRAFIVPQLSIVGSRSVSSQASSSSSSPGARWPALARRTSHYDQALHESRVSRPRRTATSWQLAMSASEVPEQSPETRRRTRVRPVQREEQKEETEEEEDDEHESTPKKRSEKWWRVLLHNDDIHTFDFVTIALSDVVKHLSLQKSYDIAMETHTAGKATIVTAWKDKAEKYCLQLQQCGLTASIAPDSKFEGSKDEGEGGGAGV